MGVHAFQKHLHASLFRGKFHSVGKKIPHYLLQAVGISADDDIVERIDDRLQADALGVRRRTGGVDGAAR